MSYSSFDFPHTHFYDSDLREVLAKLKFLLDEYDELVSDIADLNEWKEQHQGEYEELVRRVENIENEINTFETRITELFAELDRALHEDFEELKAETRQELDETIEEFTTADIYSRIDSAKGLPKIDTDGMISAIAESDTKKIGETLSNVMETVTIADCPEISGIKKKMVEFGAFGSVMSGSGPSVFGIFPDNESAKKACDYFSVKYERTFLTHTI